jgi:hypothetical protein
MGSIGTETIARQSISFQNCVRSVRRNLVDRENPGQLATAGTGRRGGILAHPTNWNVTGLRYLNRFAAEAPLGMGSGDELCTFVDLATASATVPSLTLFKRISRLEPPDALELCDEVGSVPGPVYMSHKAYFRCIDFGQ